MVLTLIIGVAGSIIGSVIWVIGSNIYRYIKYYKDSEYSGVWMDTIPPTVEGAQEKHDEIIVKHNKRTNTISGTLKRTAPHNESSRTWEMNGVIDDGYFIASFWHDGPQKSNGCVYTKLTGDNRYDGYYLEEHDGIIDRTPITLVKNKFNQSS